jgi:hypothetical protein
MTLLPETTTSRVLPTRKKAEKRAALLVKHGNISQFHIVRTGRGEFAILARPRAAKCE